LHRRKDRDRRDCPRAGVSWESCKTPSKPQDTNQLDQITL
jgi:hypothetical protein